jgi:CRISPR-associated exonuclease Cas4
MIAVWWVVFSFLLIAGAALVVISHRWEAEAGIRGGHVVWVDLERYGRPAPPMIDKTLGLSGRPDLVLETRKGWIPVEIKSGKAPATPHLSHVLQAAAYCRLVQVTSGRRPARGVLQYADRGYSLPYTRAMETRLVRTIERIRAQAGELPNRSHADSSRCAACGHASVCDQRLAVPQGGEGGWL